MRPAISGRRTMTRWDTVCRRELQDHHRHSPVFPAVSNEFDATLSLSRPERYRFDKGARSSTAAAISQIATVLRCIMLRIPT
ncbi:MAG: hypothetical protein ABJZ55_20680 [Fuerstiella sp.]